LYYFPALPHKPVAMMGVGRVTIFFLGPKQLRWAVYLLISVIIIAGILVGWRRMARQFMGVKAGVRLEEYPVGGFLPEEVARIVKAMAAKMNREPQNACYFPETGEIIPARPGRSVDVAATVNMVCSARSGANLKVLISNIPPAVSDDFFKPVYHGRPGCSRVALAINVAWGEEYIPDLLRIFQEEKVKVTFFLVGTWVKAFPEMVRTMEAAGHELANHGLEHGHPSQMSRDQLKQLIQENTALIRSVTGKQPAALFAPPYGELTSQIVSTAGELGYRTIMWSVDSVDWKRPAPEIIIERVLSKIEPGGIVLLHPTVVTRAAMKNLIHELRKKGLEPGTVSSVL
jgi:probable sporulation protein (polysaccharide deacetylase family)